MAHRVWVVPSPPDELETSSGNGLVIRDGMTMNFDYAVEATIRECTEEELIALLFNRFDCVDRHKQLEELQAFAHRLHVHVDDQMTSDGFTNDEEIDEDQPRCCPVCGKEREDE